MEKNLKGKLYNDDEKKNPNSKNSKFKLVKHLRIRNKSIEKALILQDGNLLVYYNSNIIIYDKNDFSIKYKYEIKKGRNEYICKIVQLTNGKVVCCLTWPPNSWGRRIIILDISNNKIEQKSRIKAIFS